MSFSFLSSVKGWVNLGGLSPSAAAPPGSGSTLWGGLCSETLRTLQSEREGHSVCQVCTLRDHVMNLKKKLKSKKFF